MGKAKRKPKPSMPRWFWLDTDGCWWCDNRNNCGSCKILKRANALIRKERERKNKVINECTND